MCIKENNTPQDNLTTEPFQATAEKQEEEKPNLMNIDENNTTMEVRQFEELNDQSQAEIIYPETGTKVKKTRLKSGLRKSKNRNTATKSLKSGGKMAAYGEVFHANISPIKQIAPQQLIENL